MPFKNMSSSSEKSELLERLRSILPNDTSDTSGPETADNVMNCLMTILYVAHPRKKQELSHSEGVPR